MYLQAMVIGAALIGGAFLMHQLYKRAVKAVKSWIRSNSSMFSKPNVSRAFAVFGALTSGVTAYFVIGELNSSELVLMEEDTNVSINQMPSDVKSDLNDSIKKKRKGNMISGYKQTEDVFIARELEHSW